MKKIFISVPMKRRTHENIQKTVAKMKAVVTEMFRDIDEIEFINSFVTADPDNIADMKNVSLYYLGESIKKIGESDYIVGFGWFDDELWPGCNMEKEVANIYRIQYIDLGSLDIYMPDLKEIRERYWDQKHSCNENTLCEEGY